MSDSKPFGIVVGVSREDSPADVDAAWGEGTYARLFPRDDGEDVEGEGGGESDLERDRR
jgi:hypothetical protein